MNNISEPVTARQVDYIFILLGRLDMRIDAVAVAGYFQIRFKRECAVPELTKSEASKFITELKNIENERNRPDPRQMDL